VPPLIENTTRVWPDGAVSSNNVCEPGAPDTPVVGRRCRAPWRSGAERGDPGHARVRGEASSMMEQVLAAGMLEVLRWRAMSYIAASI
jgi:hypothetical protein